MIDPRGIRSDLDDSTFPTSGRERTVPTRDQAVAELATFPTGATTRLAELVRTAQRLSRCGTIGELLDAMARDLSGSFTAEFVAVLLLSPDGQLEPGAVRDRRTAAPATPPRAIVERVVNRQVAFLTAPPADIRRDPVSSFFPSVMAVPLLSEQRQSLGVLYVERSPQQPAFEEVDLAALMAFAGIAAAAVERELAAGALARASRVRANFARYFAPQIAERIAASGSAVPGGVRAPVVVLFSDVRGFTAIAESLPPVAMANQLNEYFAAMVDCVFRHDGALDKFIGDALLAWWGAPEARPDDARMALDAAVEMMHAMAALNVRWAREGRPGWDIGIGIHGGEAFVGNIGSPQRLDFTIIGDTVNTANRVCRLAAEGEILMTESIAVQMENRTTAWARQLRPDLSLSRRHGPPLSVWQVAHAA